MSCELHVFRDEVAKHYAKLPRERQRTLLEEVMQNMRERCRESGDYSEIADLLVQQLGGDALILAKGD